MGQNSAIEWTDHTFNPWLGCTKVSPGCKHCYAETLMDHRYGRVKWGPQGERTRTSPANWKKPLQWDRQRWGECIRCGWRGHLLAPHHKQLPFCGNCGSQNTAPTRARVFCASLADVFEDNPQVEEWRVDLFDLIDKTPNLDWLLLTKRPENVIEVTVWGAPGCKMPSNVWIGTSVENQEQADKRIPHLLRIPAAVRFLSVEPLLGPVDIRDYLHGFGRFYTSTAIDWVIVGGESGPQSRAMHRAWPQSLRDQCRAAGVPFFFKQWGGKNKKAAGRLLDGREWSEFPQAVQVAG